MAFVIISTSAATAALAGIVIIHAYTILLPNPHLTADSLFVAPTPIMAPAIA